MTTTSKVVFKTVDEYHTLQPEHVRVLLDQLREIIHKAVPEVEEGISYQMPSYRYHGILLWYAGYKNHCGLYIRPKFLDAFRDQLSDYKLAKSAIQFPLDKPLPKKLISTIVKYVAKENSDQATRKETLKKTKSKK